MADSYTKKLISTIDVFMELADEDLEALADAATELILQPAEYVFRQNDVSSSFYVIKAGVVRIQRASTVLAELKPGDIFGEMGVLDDKVRGASAQAATSVVLLCISKEALFEVIGERRSVEMKIRRKILERHTANIATTFHRN